MGEQRRREEERRKVVKRGEGKRGRVGWMDGWMEEGLTGGGLADIYLGENIHISA